MAIFNISRGNSSSLPTIKTDGSMYFCTDTGMILVDYTDDGKNLHRKYINANDAQSLSGRITSTELRGSDDEIPTSNAVKKYVDSVATGSGSSSGASYNTETWTFTLVDGTIVSKEVLVK